VSVGERMPEPADTVDGLKDLNIKTIQSYQTVQTTSTKAHWKIFIPPKATTIENSMTIPAVPNPPYTSNQLKAEMLLLKSGKYILNSKFNTANYRSFTLYHPNRRLVLSLANAFDIGFATNSRQLTGNKIKHRNHHSSIIYKDEVQKFKSKEVQSGRLIVITEALLEEMGYYHNSPLAVIDQGKKCRTLIDMSYEAGTAVNAHIRKHDFGHLVMDRISALGSHMRQSFQNKTDIWIIIQDVEAYFRNLPLQVRDQLLHVIRYDDGETVINANENFGNTGAPFKACALGDTICYILEKHGIIAAMHYSDNFFNLTNALRGKADLKTILKVFAELGLPLNENDSVLGQQFKLLGFWVDLKAYTISIPRGKRLDIVKEIDEFVGEEYITLKDLRHIVGVLVHYSQVIESANCYNSILWNVSAAYGKKAHRNTRIKWDKHEMLRECLVWFRETLLIWSGVALQQELAWETQYSLGCSSDASHIGGSCLTPTTYSYHVWCPCCIKQWNRDMTPLELGSTLIGFGTMIGRELISKRALWVSDNFAGCVNYNKGYSKGNKFTSSIIMELHQVAIQNQVELCLHWTSRKNIPFADMLTRGSDVDFRRLDKNQREYIEPQGCRSFVPLSPTGTRPMVFGFKEFHPDHVS
jgi:hypothetical protein